MNNMPRMEIDPSDYGVVQQPDIKRLDTAKKVEKAFSKLKDTPTAGDEDLARLFAGVAKAGRPFSAAQKLKALCLAEGHLNQNDYTRFERRGRKMLADNEKAYKSQRDREQMANLVEIATGDFSSANPSMDIAAPLGGTMEEAIATLSMRFRVISISGKFRVLRVPDPEKLSSEGVSLETMSSADFVQYHADRKIYDAEKDEWINPATVFLGIAQRLSGMVFAPPPIEFSESCYNLYQGRKLMPRKGDCRRLKQFILHTVCRGRDDLFKFVWLWLAHLVQKPGEKPQTAIVLRGLGGCGKSTFGLLLERLVAPYSMTISEAEHVTGRFAGAHLSTCILAICTEALFAGDPKVNGKIKSLVTSTSMMVEPKGLPVVQMQSCVRMFFDSNNERVVPIDGNGSERRYCVMEINDDHQNDRDYFDPLYADLDGEGIAALAYELDNYDPSEHGLRWDDVRVAPDTPERRRMRWHSMSPVERAIIRMIEDGAVTMRTEGGQTFRYTFSDDKPIRLPSSELRAFLAPSSNQYEAKEGDLTDLLKGLFGETVVDENGTEHVVCKVRRSVIHCEEFVNSSDAKADEWDSVKRSSVRFLELPPRDLLRNAIAERFNRT